MNSLYFNCSAGISGDMIVGALLDLGITSHEKLILELSKLNLHFSIEIYSVIKSNQAATKFNVITPPSKISRNINEIFLILDKSKLNFSIIRLAKQIFIKLGNAEAIAHDCALETVHFHEVGAVDSIIDIVASSILLTDINATEIICSTISDGTGQVTNAHGIVDLPVPAVKELLKNIPMHIRNINKELTTPTGAAIITTIATDFIDDCNMVVKKTGFGAGTADLNFPNVLEIRLGSIRQSDNDKLLLETTIDDLSPEFYDHIINKLLQNGAVDSWVLPCFMKKNRPGALLSVMVTPQTKNSIVELIFSETSTLGLRVTQLDRIIQDRENRILDTPYGKITVKIASYHGRITSQKPEYEECKKIANDRGIPLKTVIATIQKLL